MTALFVAAAFVSATLLFAVQPLATRMVLPDFGGSAAVWTTSVLFFQTALLLGYLYTHVATSRLRPRRQVVLHLVLFLVPTLVLPLSVVARPGEGGTMSMVLRLLVGLTAGVGLPFLLVSTSGPLLQRWFSWTSHRRAHDPYFLYAASNVGSILGLLTYPVVVEPLLDVRAQAVWWTGGYVLLGLLVAASAVAVLRRPAEPQPDTPTGTKAAAPPTDAPPPTVQAPADTDGPSRTRVPAPVRWVALAFVPSSLMLGVTTFLSTDIAAVPLLWVVPLAIYLGTFVIAFGGRSEPVADASLRALASFTLLAAVAVLGGWPIVLAVVLVLVSFALVAMVFHHRLAASRPPAVGLTAFYVWMSVGGALGGVVNGILAPLLLPGPYEFAIVAIVAAAVAGRPLDEVVAGGRLAFWGWAGAILAGAVGLGVAVSRGALPFLAVAAVAGAVAVVLVFAPAGRSKLAVTAVVALLVVPTVSPYVVAGGDAMARSFFGSYRVTTTADRRAIYSGTTLHGLQLTDASRSGTPTSYYHPDGPVGDWLPLADPDATIGVVGLGAGSIAAYGQPGQQVRFHEIDPLVVELARRHFTYLDDADAEVDVVVGDGRLTVADQPEGTYDALVVDAFSSDSIPVHLLTVEAFEVYREVLADDGVLLVHVSNRYLDLEPVVAAAGERVGLTVRTGRDGGGDDGRAASIWVALTTDEQALADLDPDRWQPPGPDRVVWTDSWSNLLSVLAG